MSKYYSKASFVTNHKIFSFVELIALVSDMKYFEALTGCNSVINEEIAKLSHSGN